ncbi:MAG: peptidoglycan-binding domain-containing protein [Actinomycetes bacterium]
MKSLRVAALSLGLIASAIGMASCSSKDSTPSTSTSTSAAATKAGTLSVSSKSVNKTFTVTSCTTGNETEVSLEADNEGVTARLTAWGGSGALSVTGGDESDGIDLNGQVDSIEIGDTGQITASGTFAGPNFAGEAFTVSGSCNGADKATTTTEAGSKDLAAASKEELAALQNDLNVVGCFVGAADGTSGPKTVSAVKSFQAASGLNPDGVLGPRTQTALEDAAAAKRTVCSSAGTTVPGQKVLTITAPSYTKTFAIGTCKSDGETSVNVTAQSDGLTATIAANDNTGTLTVDGSTESDGVSLKGTVTSVTVGDTGDLQVTGKLTGTNFAGEQFTATGSCS